MKIKDIAERAGVSTATVSNVINGNHHKVSKATIDRVQKIIAELGYNPSATARSLASRESRIIGVVVPHLHEDESFSLNPYMSQIIGTLEAYVRKQGYYLMIRGVREFSEVVPVFSGWNIDGAILLGTVPSDVPNLENQIHTPIVYLDNYTREQEIANVGIDDYKGGRLSANYLLEKGHRKIAMATPFLGPGAMEQRLLGFRDALQEWGIPLEREQIFECSTASDEGAKLGRQIARSQQGFTAVGVMSDIIAVGIMEGIRLEGKRVPEDISVVGFDNLMACRYAHPGLTTISQNIEEKANVAAECLFDMIRRKEKTAVHKVLDVELVERQSVKDLTK